MFAYGYKQTSRRIGDDVRFTPESERKWPWCGMSAYSQKRTFTTVPDEPRNDRVRHNTNFAKDVQWHRLSRPRRAPFRPGEVLGIGIHARAFYRTWSRIELSRPDFWAGSAGVGFPLSGFLRRFRLCSLAGLSFGHVCFAFLSRFVEL